MGVLVSQGPMRLRRTCCFSHGDMTYMMFWHSEVAVCIWPKGQCIHNLTLFSNGRNLNGSVLSSFVFIVASIDTSFNGREAGS